MITQEEFFQYLVDTEPKSLTDYLSFIGENELVEKDIYGVFIFFDYLVYQKVDEGNLSQLTNILNYFEFCLIENNAESYIQEAICVSFLESLIDRYAEKPEILNKIIPLLGKESLYFCQEWNRIYCGNLIKELNTKGNI